jgi:hypothetical protein
MDTAQAASIANKELQSLSQELHDQREADNAASGAEIAVLKAESQSTILALQQEIVSLKQRQADDWEASCVGLHSLDAHHAESIEALRKDLIARIESLINTIAIVNDNSTKAAASVKSVEESWEHARQDLLKMYDGLRAELRQDLIRMQWSVDAVKKEPEQLRSDLKAMTDKAIAENRQGIRQELQQIGQFSSLVYRKLLELDGTAPASLYGRIKLPIKQGDPVVQEPPTTDVKTGVSPEAHVDAIDKRLAVIETLLTAPLISVPEEEPRTTFGNRIEGPVSPTRFGNRINLGV